MSAPVLFSPFPQPVARCRRYCCSTTLSGRSWFLEALPAALSQSCEGERWSCSCGITGDRCSVQKLDVCVDRQATRTLWLPHDSRDSLSSFAVSSVPGVRASRWVLALPMGLWLVMMNTSLKAAVGVPCWIILSQTSVYCLGI